MTNGSAPVVLRRSKSDRVVAGVCSGLGRYLGIDPVLIRIGFVVALLLFGFGPLLYLILWLVVPEERPGDNTGPRKA